MFLHNITQINLFKRLSLFKRSTLKKIYFGTKCITLKNVDRLIFVFTDVVYTK